VGGSGCCYGFAVTDRLLWWKSSRSHQNGACVEIARDEDAVAVRDSKAPTGDVLRFPLAAWTGFVAGLKAGEFD